MQITDNNRPKVTYTMDAGKNEVHVYSVNAGEMKTFYTKNIHELFAWIASLGAEDFIVGEYAHFGVPRTDKSRSQPFEPDTLTSLYSAFETSGVSFRLIAHDSSPRARQRAIQDGVITDEKTDENDCKSYAHLLNNTDSSISLMLPPTSFEPSSRRLDGYKAKDDLNYNLNFARSYKYDPNQVPLAKLVSDNINDLRSSLSKESVDVLRIEVGKNGKVGKTKLKNCMTTIYTVAATVFSENAKPQTREDHEELPGWCFIKRHVLCMSPNHRKGGVARSNLFYHGFRGYLNRSTGTGVGKKHVPNDPEINFCRTYEAKDSNGNDITPKIKRGHMTQKEERVFLEHRAKFIKALHELHTYFRNLAVKEMAKQEKV